MTRGLLIPSFHQIREGLRLFYNKDPDFVAKIFTISKHTRTQLHDFSRCQDFIQSLQEDFLATECQCGSYKSLTIRKILRHSLTSLI